MRSCASCIWGYDDTCRRLPPVASQDGDTALFPVVRPEWFCGEWALKPIHPSERIGRHEEPNRNAPGYGLVLELADLKRREKRSGR